MFICRDEIWNSSISWDTHNPNLTDCCQSMLSVVVCLVYIIVYSVLCLLPLTRHLQHAAGGRIQTLPRGGRFGSVLVASRVFCYSFCLILTALLPALQRSIFVSDILSSGALVLACIISTGSELVMINRMQHTSGPNTIFWSVLTVALLPGLKRSIEDLYFGSGELHAAITVSRWMFVLSATVLQGFSNRSVLPPDIPLENSASFLSSIFFSWLTDMVWKGWRRPLIQDDLPDLHLKLNVADNARKLEERQNKCRAGGTRLVLWKCLFRCFSSHYWVGMLLFLTRLLFVFSMPMLVKLIILFISNEDKPVWQGYFYAFLLFFCSFFEVILGHQGLLLVCISANQMRSAVVAAVYRKSLLITNEARQSYTTGKITNFMSVDAQRLMDSIPFSYFMLVSPVEIVICLVLVYLNIGWSMFAGLLVMVVLIPINLYTSQRAKGILEEQLKAKDERIKMMNEILAGIKVLKLYAWELPFMEIVNTIRNSEVKMLRSIAKLWALVNFTFGSVPFLMTLTTFLTFIFTSEESLSPDIIFVCMTLFNLLRNPITIFPLALMDFIKLLVSVQRLDEFLNADELEDAHGSHGCIDRKESDMFPRDTGNILEVKGGTWTWDSKEMSAPTLSDLDVSVKQGELVAVVGLVGAGKSSFLSAILGEMTKLKGEVRRCGSTAYVAQQAWIQNMSVKENILFGRGLDQEFYEVVINACRLASDLKQLPAGDQTEIGENGVNLSGGQKQRIAMARAVYQRADLYLLDDPLAALDAHVGAAVFRDVIGQGGILQGSTRILVTHNLAALSHVDRILLVRDGRIALDGSYQDLLNKDSSFAEFIKVHINDLSSEVVPNLAAVSESTRRFSSEIESIPAVGSVSIGRGSADWRSEAEELVRRRALSACSSLSVEEGRFSPNTSLPHHRTVRRPKSITIGSQPPDNGVDQFSDAAGRPRVRFDEPNLPPGDPEVGFAGPGTDAVVGMSVHRLTEDEEALTGSVKMSIYKKYIKALGIYTCAFSLLMYILCEVLLVGTNLTLSNWSDRPDKDESKVTNNFILVYSLLGASNTLFFYCKELAIFLASAEASRKIHKMLVGRVMHCPMSFFDTNPIGRVLNRFSKDIDVVDQEIPFQLDDFLNCLSEVIGILFIICYSSAYFLVAILPISIFYLVLQKLYISSSRQIRRLDMISSSPIFSHFTETVTGATSIRAFNATERFTEESINLVSRNNQCCWASLNSNRWLGVRLENIGNLIILASSTIAVASRGYMSPGMAGLSISYSLMSTETLNWMVRMICGLETNAICLERIFEYCARPEEAAWETEEDHRIQQQWPQSGSIEFANVSVSYRDSLPPVLKDISFHIRGGEKIGICGRTGAGKSSLSLLIFRIMELNKGRVQIDGVDISGIGLQRLRQRLTIIPQDPVLFSTSLRLNLDPSRSLSDSTVKGSLDLVGLSDLKDQLDQEVQEKGENLSVGQRQLLCLARAILKKTRILVLDEATAAIDVQTDNVVHKIIREQFKDCTVLTIAHRINTILDSDRVMVLDKGEIVELDKPQLLLKNAESAFYSLAKESGVI